MNGVPDHTPLSQDKYLTGVTTTPIDLIIYKRRDSRRFVGHICKLHNLHLSCSLRGDRGQLPRIAILIVFDERVRDGDDASRTTMALKKLMIGRSLMRIRERADAGRMCVLEAVQ